METDTTTISQLSYEQARDELISIVRTLESGQGELAETLTLWERGEALAAHCKQILDSAQQRLARAQADSQNAQAEGAGDN